MHIGDNPQALAAVVTSLGGSIVDDNSFSFPVGTVREAIPKLETMGIGVTTVRQYVATNARNGNVETVAVFRAHKKDDGPTILKGRGTSGLGV